MSECLEDLIRKGKIIKIQKDTKKDPPSNYRPITCLPMMWKNLNSTD